MNYPESLVRHLMRTVRCSVCEATYEADNVSVLGHQDELWFVAVRCAHCQTQGLIAALVRDGAAESAASDGWGSAPIDRQAAAGRREPPGTEQLPADRGPVTQTDVDDMREFLADFDGDLAALLAR